MICETKHTGQDIDLVVTGLAAAPEAVRASAALLSDAERNRARRFAFDRDASRFIVARARLRQLLAARLGVGESPGELAVRFGCSVRTVQRIGDEALLARRRVSDSSRRLSFEERERWYNRWHEVIDAGDPFYSPNLTHDREDLSLGVHERHTRSRRRSGFFA